MRVGKWPLRHSAPIFYGVGVISQQIEIVYLGKNHKPHAIRNSSLGMSFAMSKVGVSKLFPE